MPPGYAQPKPKKKLTRRPLFWILIVVVIFFGGCIGIVAGTANHVVHVAEQNHKVVYSVTGSGPATVTYATVQSGSGQNGESQASDATLPWSKTITASGLFTSFVVSATVGEGGGSVTCKITEDGAVLNTNTATGAFATASCNATGKTS